MILHNNAENFKELLIATANAFSLPVITNELPDDKLILDTLFQIHKLLLKCAD